MIALDFDKLGGLVPSVTQEADTGEVLMIAFMNQEAFQRTLESGYAHYYSRSRGTLWKKGESSGHLQEVREVRVDCDQDAVLLRVRQIEGSACHTGHRSCFYRLVKNGELVDTERS